MNRYKSTHGEIETGKAHYIAEFIEMEIRERRLKESEKLPSERKLADQFKVSRMTVRRALQTLQGKGLVNTQPEHGTFVARISKPETAEELRRSSSFVKEMELIGHRPDIYWIEQPALIAASAEIAERLQLQNDSLVFKRYRLQSADGIPKRLIKSYYPADLFGELLTTNIGNQPLFDWLQERHGLQAKHVKEVLVARIVADEEWSLLGISPHAPVVVLERSVWTNTGRPIEWANIVAVAARNTFEYEYDIPSR